MRRIIICLTALLVCLNALFLPVSLSAMPMADVEHSRVSAPAESAVDFAPFDALSSAECADIARAYVAYLENVCALSDVQFVRYGGNYHGITVLRMDAAGLARVCALMPYTVAGFTFYGGSTPDLLAYSHADGTIVSLETAYAQKLLTAQDIADVYYWYTPRPDASLVQAYVAYTKQYGYLLSPDDVSIRYNCGSFRDGIQVLEMAIAGPFDTGGPDIVVAGYVFSYPVSPNPFIAWYNGQIYEVPDAYAQGLLRDEDIAYIYAQHLVG